MVKPEFFAIDRFDFPVTRATLHELACNFAEEEFALKGDSGYLWLIAVDNTVRWVRTRWADEHEKVVCVGWMRDVLRLTGAHAYCTVQEAWAAAYSEDMPEADKQLIKKAQGVGFYTLPERLRDDVLMVWSFGGMHGAEAALSRYLVNGGRPGKLAFLGPRIDEDDYTRVTGRMWNLLKFDLEADMQLMANLRKLAAEKGGDWQNLGDLATAVLNKAKRP